MITLPKQIIDLMASASSSYSDGYVKQECIKALINIRAAIDEFLKNEDFNKKSVH